MKKPIKKNSIIANATWIISCKIVQAVLGVVITMLSARYLGPSNFGLINYAASLVAFAVPVMQLGFRYIIVQEVINQPEKEGTIVCTALVFNVVSALACIVGVIAVSFFSNSGEAETIIICALYSLSLFFQAVEMIQYWFQAKLLSRYVSVTSLSAYFFVSIYKIFILVTDKGVYWFAISNSVDFFLIGITLVIIYKKLSNQNFAFSIKLGCVMFSKGKYFIISTLMVTIFAQTDKVMIKAMIDEQSVGFYSAAYSCAGMTSFVFAAIIDSVRPVAIENKIKGNGLFDQSIENCYSIVIYLSLIQSLLFSCLAPVIIDVLYGDAYSDSIPVLRLIVWYTTFSYVGAVRDIWILSEGKQKYLLIVNAIGAFSNITLNYLLIPIWGITGAASASIATQFITNIVTGYCIAPLRYNNKLMIRGLNPKNLVKCINLIVKKNDVKRV